jgi:5-methylcytosine-specific restriction protein A
MERTEVDYRLKADGGGGTLDARVSVEGGRLTLHSRSGASSTHPARNPDYARAYEALFYRLGASDSAIRQVLLDSEPAHLHPEPDRALAAQEEIRTLPTKELLNLVRKRMKAFGRTPGMPKGQGNGNKRLRIDTSLSEVELVRRLRASPWDEKPPSTHASPGSAADRLPAADLRKVKPEHIAKAIARLLAGEDAGNFAPSTEYDVLTGDGHALAPKKVFGLALEEALGIQATPAHFSAGWGTPCFDILEESNLWIVPKKSGAPRRPDRLSAAAPLPDMAVTEEERTWIEGNPRIVRHLKRERRPGLAKAKRSAFIKEHGKLSCEDCGMTPAEVYGSDAGEACIEVHHHALRVAEMDAGHETKLSDLKCLCANCHRVLHRRLAIGLL